MRIPRTIFGTVAVLMSLVFMPVASAQLAPGLRAPENKVDAMELAHSMSCFLAVASRPVPGLNMDAPELMGEGHFAERAAPEWLVSHFTFDEATNFSRATTPEGDIWIAFEQESKRCTIAATTDDPAAMMNSFVNEVFDSDDWKRKRNNSNAGFYYRMKLGGIKFHTIFPDIPAESGVFAFQLLTD